MRRNCHMARRQEDKCNPLYAHDSHSIRLEGMHKPTDVQYSRRIGVTTRKASISNCRGLAGVAVFLTIETLAKRVCMGWIWLNQAIAGKKLVGCCNSVICSLVVVLISSRVEDLCLGKKVTWQLVALIEDHKCMEVAKHEWYIYAVHRALATLLWTFFWDL